jgi:hypothetical protein
MSLNTEDRQWILDTLAANLGGVRAGLREDFKAFERAAQRKGGGPGDCF